MVLSFAWAIQLGGCASPPASYACAECEITTDSIVTLVGGPPQTEASVGSLVRRSGAGFYVTGNLIDPAVIAIYDAEGRFVRSVGRTGDGPGEFREIREIRFGRADSLYVLHDGRLSVLSPAFEYVRTISYAGRPATYLVVRDDGSFVTAQSSCLVLGRILSHSTQGQAISLPEHPASESECLRGISLVGDTLWTARSGPGLDRSIVGGNETEAVFQPTKWWVDDLKKAKKGNRGHPPRISDIEADSSGLVWVAAHSFQPVPKPKPSGSSADVGPKRLDAEDWGAYARSILEVMDSRDGRPIAGRRTDLVVGGLVDGSHLFAVRSDSSGTSRVTVYRLGLKRPLAERIR